MAAPAARAAKLVKAMNLSEKLNLFHGSFQFKGKGKQGKGGKSGNKKGNGTHAHGSKRSKLVIDGDVAMDSTTVTAMAVAGDSSDAIELSGVAELGGVLELEILERLGLHRHAGRIGLGAAPAARGSTVTAGVASQVARVCQWAQYAANLRLHGRLLPAALHRIWRRLQGLRVRSVPRRSKHCICTGHVSALIGRIHGWL